MRIQPLAKRQGFMLIELLLLLVIGSLTVGILITAIGRMHGSPEEDLPVVNPLLEVGVKQVREAAARTTTINNIRQLVVAAHNCHNTYKKFPPYWGFYPGRMANPTSVAQRQERSLHFHLLPYIDGVALYNTGNASGVMPWYLSPLDTTATDGTDGAGRGVTSYLANQCAFATNVTNPQPSTYTRMPASFNAGTSNTVFFVTATAKGSTDKGTSWHYWGGNPTQTAAVAYFVGNQPLPPLPLKANMGPYQRGVQLTRAGSNVGMGDASTRMVSPNISPAVWQAVTNPQTTVVVPFDWDQK